MFFFGSLITCYVLRSGYKTDNIEKNGSKEWNETLEEWCYLLPLTTVSQKEIHRRCEEEVVSAEMAVRRKKNKALPSSAAAVQEEKKTGLEDLLSESDDEEHKDVEETQKQRRQREAREKAKAERAEKASQEKEQKAAKRATVTANKKIVKLATGTVSALSDCVAQVGKALQSQAADSVDDALKASATECLTTLKDWKNACQQALVQHGKNVETPLTLPFDTNKEVAEKIKEAKALKDSILGKKRKVEKK